MTARHVATSLLVEDGFDPETAVAWVDNPADRGTAIFVQRNRRAEALRRSAWQETPQSERAGAMIRALLAL